MTKKIQLLHLELLHLLELVQRPVYVLLHGVRHEPRDGLDPEPDLGGHPGGHQEVGEGEVGDQLQADIVHHDVDRAEESKAENIVLFS